MAIEVLEIFTHQWVHAWGTKNFSQSGLSKLAISGPSPPTAWRFKTAAARYQQFDFIKSTFASYSTVSRTSFASLPTMANRPRGYAGIQKQARSPAKGRPNAGACKAQPYEPRRSPSLCIISQLGNIRNKGKGSNSSVPSANGISQAGPVRISRASVAGHLADFHRTSAPSPFQHVAKACLAKGFLATAFHETEKKPRSPAAFPPRALEAASNVSPKHRGGTTTGS